jgi:hypothetical protein
VVCALEPRANGDVPRSSVTTLGLPCMSRLPGTPSSSYHRGTDLFRNTYNFLDPTPLGRQGGNPENV